MAEPTNTRAYPNEIAAVVRQQTFFIDSYLSPAASDDGYDNAPLMMYGHFSRYRAYIINKDKKRAYANISVQAMQALINLSNAVYPEYIKDKMLGASGGADDKPAENHPGYSVTFSSGAFKGQTPAQILLRDGEKAVDALRGQYKFLRDNVTRYPRNQMVMDAITDAVDLFKRGELSADSASTGAGRHVTLYDVSLRPLVRQKRDDGMCFVYNAKIMWDFSADAPITIAIENYYAPVERLNDGRLNVHASQRDMSTLVSNTMTLSVDEWMWCVHQAEMDMRRFEAINAQKTWDDAQQAIVRQRNSAVNANNGAGSYAPEMPTDPVSYNSAPDPEYPNDDDALFSAPDEGWA